MQNLQTQSFSFESTLDQAMAQLWPADPFAGQVVAFVKGAEVLAKEMIQLGDFCLEQLPETGSPLGREYADLLPFYIGNYSWPERAKAFLLLWRDIFFQLQKARLLHLDQQIDQAAMARLEVASRDSLSEAGGQLKNYIDAEAKAIRETKKGTETAIGQWRLQNNPWPAYKEQLEAIPQQCRQLAEDHNSLEKFSKNIRQIRKSVETYLANATQGLENVRSIALEAIAFIDEHLEEKPSKIAPYLETLEAEASLSKQLSRTIQTIETNIDALEGRKEVPVATEEGLILFKEINFERNIRQWMESEILPVLNECGDLSESWTSTFSMALVNIRNRVLLLANEIKEGREVKMNKDNLEQPLVGFLEKTESWVEDLSGFKKTIEERLGTSFYLSAIYDLQEDFLPLPLQSTLNQLRSNQSELLVRVREWLSRQLNTLRRIRSSVEREESLSISEKIVRFVQSRTIDTEHNPYSNIFLTKGYVGESFWVGRKRELQRIKKGIHQWHQGFRGAVILSGQRLSGKSLFGDLVAHRYFHNQTIRLAPHTSIEVQGRTLSVTSDLEEALEFIQKYTLTQRTLVWIDDLELWRDTDIPLHQNVRALCQHIDNYANRIFYMVSMSNWLKDRLNKTDQISKVFQAEINLDHMNVEEIRQAILIRHGATHKMLVDEEGQEASPQQFKKVTSKVYRNSEGNIGEALHQWAFSIDKVDDARVRFRSQSAYSLPDFLHPDSALMLATLMMEKRSNEHRLSKLFGPSFKEKYKSILQRLISVGLLTRRLDGWLEVNEIAANEVGRWLERKQYLKFHD